MATKPIKAPSLTMRRKTPLSGAAGAAFRLEVFDFKSTFPSNE